MNDTARSEDSSTPINITVNYVLTCVFLFIGIVGILGNLLVIVSVRLDSRMSRSLTNRLIVHVACCDLIILLLNLPDLIQFVSSTNGNWLLTELACKLIRSILVLAQYASVLTMCAVTIERFIGIVYPLRSKFLREEKHVAQITLFVWLFSFACASPNLFYLRIISPSPAHRFCSLLYSKTDPLAHQRGYIIHKSLESTIFYFLPLILQLYCYTRIAAQLFKGDQTLHAALPLSQVAQYPRTQDEIDDDDEVIDHLSRKLAISDCYLSSPVDQKRTFTLTKSVSTYSNSPLTTSKIEKKRNDFDRWRVYSNTLKSRRSVIKMLVVVILIYFISFSPQVLVFLLFETNAIERVPNFIRTPYFIAFTMLLITISSASNPIVYAIFCLKFRQSFRKILRCLFLCQRNPFACRPDHTVLGKSSMAIDESRQTKVRSMSSQSKPTHLLEEHSIRFTCK